MKLSFHEYGPVVVLTISGEYTADDVGQLERVVQERMTAGAKHVMLNCEHLEFIDSKGLESWLRIRDKVVENNGQVRIISPEDNIETILNITRHKKSFETLPSLEAAVRSVR